MNNASKQNALLSFRVAPVLCCAPSLPVLSIVTPPKLTHPPGTDRSSPGIFRHNSTIVKTFDLRHKFGIDSVDQTQPGNLVITKIENDGIAFWVDQILDVIEFPAQGWGNLPALVPRRVFSRTLVLDKKIHLYSEFEKLVTINDPGYPGAYLIQLEPKEVCQPVQESESQGPKKISLEPDTVTSKETRESTEEIKSEDTKAIPVSAVEILATTDEPSRKCITPTRPQNGSLARPATEFSVMSAQKPIQKSVDNQPTGINKQAQTREVRTFVSEPQQLTSDRKPLETPLTAQVEMERAKEDSLPLKPVESVSGITEDEYKKPTPNLSR